MLVSELMLQQTPVARVLPVHAAWLERWPTPADLAAEPPGEAVRAWGRLGYPRRALRLHAAATAIVERYDGEVPGRYDELLTLPGVGDYTAAAVASFAFGRRHVVLDTNVRRVLARALRGVEFPGPSVTRAEREAAAAVLPEDDETAATWAVAVMELGALVCTATAPRCGDCPVADQCAWLAAGSPGVRRTASTRRRPGRAPTASAAAGIMAVLRDTDGPGAPGQARRRLAGRRAAGALPGRARVRRARRGRRGERVRVAGFCYGVTPGSRYFHRDPCPRSPEAPLP